MATIENRSKYWIRVKNRADLGAEFPFTRVDELKARLAALRADGYKPTFGQHEDTILVRIRQKGFRTLQTTLGSCEAAEQLIRRIADERSRGLFVDYTRSLTVSLAELIVRYLDEELCDKPKGQALKGRETYTYVLESMLRDSGLHGQRLLVKRHRRLDEAGAWHPQGKQVVRAFCPSALEWFHKPVAFVTSKDIEDYRDDRLEVVAPGTVDRELDQLARIFSLALSTWDYPLAKNPMDGARRPRYCNERDRRLVGDEEERLLAAAREEDRLRALEQGLRARARQILMDADCDLAALSPSALKRRRSAALRDARAGAALAAGEPARIYEAFVQFQIMTGARRSETLGLQWKDVDFNAKTAFIGETKNGRPRRLPLRADLLAILGTLPQQDGPVFPVSVTVLRDAWDRICALAGIEDLRIHDLRHEAISRVAEAASFSRAGAFTLVDLQAFSGHRDVRMLLRYSHLCATHLAERLDEAFAAARQHKGRRWLTGEGGVTVRELVNAAPQTNTARPASGLGETGYASPLLPTNPATSRDALARKRGQVIHLDDYRRMPAAPRGGA